MSDRYGWEVPISTKGVPIKSAIGAKIRYDRFPLDRDIYLVGFFLDKMDIMCNQMIANDYRMIYNIVKKGGDRYVKRISAI